MAPSSSSKVRGGFAMPRKPRVQSASGYYHFITRGVNKKKVFHRKTDFRFYLDLLDQYRKTFDLQIYHYCLMSNHAHALVKSEDISSLSKFGHYVQRRYAYYYCKTYKWSGQVFQSRFKSIPIEKDDYLLECGRYIERNPLRADLVESLELYPWSSYHFYTGDIQNDLLEPSPMFLGLHSSKKKRQKLYKEYLHQSRPYEELVDQSLVKG